MVQGVSFTAFAVGNNSPTNEQFETTSNQRTDKFKSIFSSYRDQKETTDNRLPVNLKDNLKKIIKDEDLIDNPKKLLAELEKLSEEEQTELAAIFSLPLQKMLEFLQGAGLLNKSIDFKTLENLAALKQSVQLGTALLQNKAIFKHLSILAGLSQQKQNDYLAKLAKDDRIRLENLLKLVDLKQLQRLSEDKLPNLEKLFKLITTSDEEKYELVQKMTEAERNTYLGIIKGIFTTKSAGQEKVAELPNQWSTALREVSDLTAFLKGSEYSRTQFNDKLLPQQSQSIKLLNNHLAQKEISNNLQFAKAVIKQPVEQEAGQPLKLNSVRLTEQETQALPKIEQLTQNSELFSERTIGQLEELMKTKNLSLEQKSTQPSLERSLISQLQSTSAILEQGFTGGQTSQDQSQSAEMSALAQMPTSEQALDNRAFLINQITDQLRAANQAGKNEIKFRLKPDFLGELKINLKVESGEIVARLLVENDLVRQNLENNMGHLKSNLVKLGFNVDHINVETEVYDSDLNYDGHSRQKFEEEQQNQENNSEFNFSQEEYIDMTEAELKDLFNEDPAKLAEMRLQLGYWPNERNYLSRMNLLA